MRTWLLKALGMVNNNFEYGPFSQPGILVVLFTMYYS